MLRAMINDSACFRAIVFPLNPESFLVLNQCIFPAIEFRKRAHTLRFRATVRVSFHREVFIVA